MLELGDLLAATSKMRPNPDYLDFKASGDELEKARLWWAKSAAAGEPEAMLRLAAFYLGKGGHAEEAFRWYERAAERGSSVAMFKLAAAHHERYRQNCSMQSLGLAWWTPLDFADPEKAKAWYQKAADAGYVDAIFNLGVLAEERGDRSLAADWYGKAIAAGNPDAFRRLAHLRDD